MSLRYIPTKAVRGGNGKLSAEKENSMRAVLTPFSKPVILHLYSAFSAIP